MKQETVQGRRIAKVVDKLIVIDKMKDEYETFSSDLLRWIEAKISELGNRDFANSLRGVQDQLGEFNTYRNIEKPPKFMDKGNLEVLLFTLQSKMRANGKEPFTPKEGRMVRDINLAWERLEKAEHERELALREELIRQEKLEQLAARFNRKAGMRETWMSENQRLVSQDNFGFDLAAVEAAAKKHEAIETDIFAYEERVQAVVAVALELETENYHDIDRINARKDNVLRLWNYLLELLKARRSRLELSLQLQHNFQEMVYILDSMEELKMRVLSDDYGKHLIGVEDLLQKHSLVEADINVLGERVKQVAQHSQRFLDEDKTDAGEGYKPCDPSIIVERVQTLEDAYAELVRLAVERRSRLEESRQLWQFYWDMAEEENWIKEMEQILSQGDIGHDLTTINLLLSKHKSLETEIRAHENTLESSLSVGRQLIEQGHFGAKNVQERIGDVMGMWENLIRLMDNRKRRLTEAVDFHQFLTDADDVDTYMLDVLRLVSSDDIGKDEANVQTLLKKHKEITEDLKSYQTTIDALHEQAGTLGEDDKPSVDERLSSVVKRYEELHELAKLRKQRLLDALSLYKLFTEADGVEQWISEKEKMLQTMTPGKDIEDCEIMKHRFDGFDREKNANASRVAVVNQLARQLLHVEHPNSQEIVARQEQLNHRWGDLRERSEAKREELASAHGVQTFHIECRETVTWIEDKMRVLEQTDELKMDLTGIMTLQRKLSGMERDLAAIQAKLDALEEESEKIATSHPEEAGDLHRFLKDLDHFQAWLSKTESDIANEDSPASLAEAEKLLSTHQQIREEIDSYVNDYTSMMEYGEKITSDPSTFDDPQYMFLRERLKALKDGWEEVHQMWENRQTLLSQSLNLQMFNRDAKQAEVLLSSQEHVLSKDESPSNLEQAETLTKKHEALLTTMDANDDKINGVLSFAERLLQEEHYAAEKITKKMEEISERRNKNRAQAMEQLERVRDQHLLHTFLQDCEELHDWIQERNVLVQEDTYRSARTIHSKWTRHQAFQSEIHSNKDRLEKILESGQALLNAKPEMNELVSPKLDDLTSQFDKLEKDTHEKGEKLVDAKRADLYDQSCDDIDSFSKDVMAQIETEPMEELKDLVGVNIMIQKQQLIETQMIVKTQQLTDLNEQAAALERMEPDKKEEIEEKRAKAHETLQKIQDPIIVRKEELMKKKDTFQFKRDVEDENLWTDEKLSLASSQEVGNSLQAVNLLLKKHKMMQQEVSNHEHRVNAVMESGQKLISEGHPESQKYERDMNNLTEKWARLQELLEQRQKNLLVNEKVQQFLYDANEAESWMSEQELYMMVEDRGKDEFSAQNLMKKHEILETSVEEFAATIRQLGETARQLIADEHPDSEAIAVRIGQVDKLYAGLKDLAAERRAKLEDALKLFMLNREVDDLEQWIAEREVIAGSHELGQDYEHVTLLIERFREFAKDTDAIGSERVAAVNEIADSLISVGHTDAATIAQWKDSLNDAWADLGELIDTRNQMLEASRELHKYFHDCKDVLSRILEKQNSMSDELGRDGATVSMLQRKHQNFLQDLSTLQSQVTAIQEESAKLQAAYAGEKAMEITNREREVVRAWMELQGMGDSRKGKLTDTGNLFRFFAMVRNLMLWMDDLMRQMSTSEKPRDVSGVELLMNNHQGHKAEIDAREDNFADLYSLGKELLSMNHYASNEIKELLSMNHYA